MSNPQHNDKLPTEYQLRLAAIAKLEEAWKKQFAERRAVYLFVLEAIEEKHMGSPFPSFKIAVEKYKTTLRDAIAAIDESEKAGFYAEATAGSGVRSGGVDQPESAVLDSGHAAQADSGTAGERGSADAAAAGPAVGGSTPTGSDGA